MKTMHIAMKTSFLIVLLMMVFYACVQVEPVSPIPEIKFISFDVAGSQDSANTNARVLEFSFIDGDADLGVYDEVHANLSNPDEMRYGIFIDFFEKVDTNYVQRYFTEGHVVTIYDTVTVEDSTYVVKKDTLLIDTLVFNQQLPYDEKMNREGQNKTIKGTMRVTLYFPLELPYDTMRLQFYIRDRELNKSNVEVTNDFANIPSSGGNGGIPD
jgi:hypothetical protein